MQQRVPQLSNKITEHRTDHDAYDYGTSGERWSDSWCNASLFCYDARGMPCGHAIDDRTLCTRCRASQDGIGTTSKSSRSNPYALPVLLRLAADQACSLERWSKACGEASTMASPAIRPTAQSRTRLRSVSMMSKMSFCHSRAVFDVLSRAQPRVGRGPTVRVLCAPTATAPQEAVANGLTQSQAYPFTDIERKWQAVWEERETFKTPEKVDMSKPKHYVLDMFPYPRCGSWLHANAWTRCAPHSDARSRGKRLAYATCTPIPLCLRHF